jgi:hypothetical protein
MNSYVFRRQEGGLDWSTHDLGLWNGVGYLILFAGTLIFLPLFKRVFFFRETTIILIALVSGAARSAIIGFSTKTWQMYVAQVAGIFSGKFSWNNYKIQPFRNDPTSHCFVHCSSNFTQLTPILVNNLVGSV